MASMQNYVKFRPLTSGASDTVDKIVQRAADRLHGLEGKAAIELRVIGAGGSKSRAAYSGRLTPSGVFLGATSIARPTLVIVTSEDALRRMAEGSYSPVSAYLDGKLRIQGDAGLGRQIIQKLAPEDNTAPLVCPALTDESWEITEPGVGSLTLTGIWFTPGGNVEIVYNWGGGFYQQVTVADSEGEFTVTQPGIYCGNIPGTNYGVAVTATDLASGKYATANYPTPC